MRLRLEKDSIRLMTDKGKQLLSDYQELQEYSEMAESKKRALETSLAIKG